MKRYIEKIDDYIENHAEEITEALLELVKIPSVRGEKKDKAPFGEDCKKVIEAVAALFEKNGFQTKINADGGYCVSYFENSGKSSIGLFSHCDVVPVDGEWHVCPPFEPVIKDGYMFGRGCNDDKSGVVQALYAAKIIKELGIKLKSDLIIFNGANEETGMQDIKSFLKNEKMPDYSIVPDGNYPCYSGEKSTVKFKLTGKEALSSVRRIYGGEALNVVLGEAFAELDDCKNTFEILNAESMDNDKISVKREKNKIFVSAQGISGHGAYPDGTESVAKVLSEFLMKSKAVNECDRRIFKDIAYFLSDSYGKSFGILHEDADFGKLTCINGIIDTDEKNRPEIFFDIRAGVSVELAELGKSISEKTDADWHYCELMHSEGYKMDDDFLLKRICENVYSEISGIKNCECKKCFGGTYSRHLKNAASIGTVAYYLAEAIELPKGHGGVHQPDEKISIKGFLEAVKILTCLIIELDKNL